MEGGREGDRNLPGVLELGGGLLLDAEDDGVGAAHADGGVALADGLERVLHLEEVAVRGEDGDRAVVAGHPAGVAGGLGFGGQRLPGRRCGSRDSGCTELFVNKVFG
jgi:hypothetical protein